MEMGNFGGGRGEGEEWMHVDVADREEREAYRSVLLQRMERLAGGRVNDAVKLAFLDGERVEAIDGLDLSALTEFKRSGNGTVEIKLADRLAVLEKLMKLLEDEEHGKAEVFFRALEGKAAEPEEERP